MMRLRVQKGRQCSPIVLESAWRGKSLPGIFWRATPRCVGLRFVAVPVNENAPPVGTRRGGVLVGTAAWCRWSRLQAVHGMGAVGSSKCGLDAMSQDIGHGVAGQRQTVVDGAKVPRPGDGSQTPTASTLSCSDYPLKACHDSSGVGGVFGPSEGVQKKLERFAVAKRRSRDAAIWAAANRPEFAEQVRKQSKCGDYLLLRQVTGGEYAGKAVLRGGDFCHQRCTCSICAILDGSKYLRAYVPKVLALLGQHKGQQLYTGVLTIKSGPDLKRQLDVMEAALGRFSQFVRNARRRGGKAQGGFGALEGGLLAQEVKVGEGGGWHVHVHGIFLGPPRWSFLAAHDQWAGFTDGNGHRTRFAKLREHWQLERGLIPREAFQEGLTAALCEVFKYPFKFEDSNPGLSWDVQRQIKGRRLRRPFGAFRGVEVPETLEAEGGIDWDLVPWVELYCKYVNGAYGSKVRSTGGKS